MQARPFGRAGRHVPLPGRGAMHAGDPGPSGARVAEYRRWYAPLRAEFDCIACHVDAESFAPRFDAYATGIDCVIVGGIDPRHIDRNMAAPAAGPLDAGPRDATRTMLARVAAARKGQV